VLPAAAARQAAEARARGEAAPLVENGRAAAEALKLVSAEWKAAGQNGREVYLLQQLRSFVEAAVARVAQTQVGELDIVDGGDGQAYAGLRGQLPGRGGAGDVGDGERGGPRHPGAGREQGGDAMMPV
jgi:flotillin